MYQYLSSFIWLNEITLLSAFAIIRDVMWNFTMIHKYQNFINILMSKLI